MQYAFFFNNARCTGCKTCELACKDRYDLTPEITYRRVIDYEGGQCIEREDHTFSSTVFAYHVSVSCNHCEDPACVHVCPTGAMHKSDDTGLVTVNSDVCIGCGYCHMACPYNAPTVDREKGHSVKCTGCEDRIAEGLAPICVDACPLRALDFKPIDEVEELGVRGDLAPLPDPSYTQPCLFIKPCEDARGHSGQDGEIANMLEVF